MSNYLFGIKSLGVPNVTNTPPLENTLPPNDCVNGSPTDLYQGYGVYSWQVLYAMYLRYQSSAAALFTKNQANNLAPGPTPVCVGPQNIFIIRHCEKNASGPNYNINNNGVARATQLINYVNELAENGYPISYIITCNPCGFNTSDPSMRPIQTASIISYMLNIPLFVYGSDSDFTEVVNALFPQTATPGVVGSFDGLNVLMIWEHSSIQQLSLNILNAAGPLGRLPPNINPTGNNELYWGDAFFKYINACPNGNYKCPPDTNSPYYDSSFDTTLPSIPNTIGPNSEYYAYLNNENFSSVYWFQGNNNNPNYIFGFSILQQPCYTCYSSCGLQIGLYQPSIPCGSTPLYYNKSPASENLENICELPVEWQVNHLN
jgi:hypothetical protein